MATSKLKSEACQHFELAIDNENLQVKHEISESCLTLDPEQLRLEKSLVRKLDMTLMPAIWLLYLFNYLDRNNIAWVTVLTLARSQLTESQADRTQQLQG